MFLVAGIFRRAMLPVFAGVVAGSAAALGIEYYLSDILFETIKQGRQFWILPAAEIFVLVVGLIAVAGPARRALDVSPVDALRDG